MQPQVLIVAIIMMFFQVLDSNAGELRGEIRLHSNPYILLRTADGMKVVRTGTWTAYGNLDGPGNLRHDVGRVRVSFDRQLAGVHLATTVERETGFVPAPDLLVGLERLSMELSFGSVLLLDSRSPDERAEASIPGSLPFTGGADLKQNRAGGAKRIVIYGSWAGDLRPYEAAREAAAAGVTDVRVFPDGLRGWRKAGKPVFASPAHLSVLLAKGSPFRVLDLRPPSPVTPPLLEGAETVAAAAVGREKMFMPDRLQQLPLFIYGDEAESLAVAAQLVKWDFHKTGDISILDSSWKEWQGRLDTVKFRPGQLPANEIGYEEFLALWQQGDVQKVLLNVKPQRDQGPDFEIHIPLEDLPERLSELPRDKEIVVYCRYGLRSAVAWQILHDNGFRTRFMNRSLYVDSSGNIGNDD